jgi:DNA-binding MarR family transcriptional regulator
MDRAQAINKRRAGESGMLLARVGRLAAEKMTVAVQSSGLRPLHVATLHELSGGARSQQALGDATGVDPVRLVGALNDLEAEGLVSRRRDPEDRRRHIVEMSDLGRARLAEAERAMAVAEEHLLSRLGPAERRRLESLLGSIAETSEAAEYPCAEALKAADALPGISSEPQAS